MSKRKWIYRSIITIVAGFVIGLAVHVGTLLEKPDEEIEVMIKFAQRQALEIAIIEQSSKLNGYKQQLAKQNVTLPPVSIPEITDPKDVNVDR